MLLQKALWPHGSPVEHQKDKQVYLRGQYIKTSLVSNVCPYLSAMDKPIAMTQLFQECAVSKLQAYTVCEYG